MDEWDEKGWWSGDEKGERDRGRRGCERDRGRGRRRGEGTGGGGGIGGRQGYEGMDVN
jgi:hypothetical protein